MTSPTWTLTLVTAPAAEPVTLAEARNHLRVDDPSDDALIDGLVVAAREWAEAFTGRAMITQTWDYSITAWPSSGTPIVLPRSPLQSVTWVRYRDAADAVQTLDAASYLVEPPLIDLAKGATWPTLSAARAYPITIRIVAGYGDRNLVPQAVRQAILLIVGALYERRGADAVESAPGAARALLLPYRARWL